MLRLSYRCTLCSDLVLKSSSASEGVSKSLDYIPGAKFLGVVAAQVYDEENPDTVAIFHSGAVRFGDASPYVEGTDVTIAPATWYLPKGQKEEGPVYLHHKLSAAQKTVIIKEDKIQLKRAKDFYVTANANTDQYGQLKVKQKFSLKSAFDANQRRSREGQLFGYYAITSGSVWKFSVDVDDVALADKINEHLVGQRRMGRSRSAQYGLVNIELIGRETITSDASVAGEITLMANSNLAFYDQYGHPTVRPTPDQLNLPAGSTIVWDESRIRHRRYATRNAKRRVNNPDRLIIARGSVFTVALSGPVNTSVWLKGVGAHRSEGFGQLLVNPRMIQESANQPGMLAGSLMESHDVPTPYRSFPVEKGEDDDLIMSFLSRKSSEREQEVQVLVAVNEFIAQYSSSNDIYRDVNNSQWGQIRQLSRRHPEYSDLKNNLFSPANGQLYAGQSQAVWRKKGRGEELEKAAEKLPINLRVRFLQKLAAEMPKIKPLKKYTRNHEA